MEKVYDRVEECCGCGLCADMCPTAAITMEMWETFYYPKIAPSKCIDCGRCRRVCIIKQPYRELSLPEKAFAGKLIDDQNRLNSSSGGAFTALSDVVLKDGGVVCGATFDELMRVRHTIATTVTQRDKMRGSKYVQSDTAAVYAQIEKHLKEGKRVLFCGSPCTAAAIKRRFAGKDKQLFVADLICHGVPSPAVWSGYVSYLESIYKKPMVGYTFRDKQKGWRSYHALATFSDGTIVKDNDAVNSYLELFTYDLCLRPSCTACPYACPKRVGDVTLGDFWGVENHLPQFDDGMGISAIFVNTPKGEKWLSKADDSLQLLPCAVRDIAAGQKNLRHPSKASVKAKSFANDLKLLPFEKVLKKYTRIGKKRRLIDGVKKLLLRH